MDTRHAILDGFPKLKQFCRAKGEPREKRFFDPKKYQNY